MPSWARDLALEMRAFIREAREDRKQANEDRKLFKGTILAIAVIARDIRSTQKRQTAILEQNTNILDRLTLVAEQNSKALNAIARAMNGKGNGPRGNGR